MDRLGCAVYGHRARLPRQRLRPGSRVLVDLTCRHSRRPTEIIDLTGDDAPYKQPWPTKELDDATKLASSIDSTTSGEVQASSRCFFCSACNGPIGPQPILRTCGCVSFHLRLELTVLTVQLYCRACDANAARRWARQDYKCHINQHWREGNHIGRQIFGLDRECSICFEALPKGQMKCLPCGQLQDHLAHGRVLMLAGHVFHERCILSFSTRANGCPYCRQQLDNNSTWTVGTSNLQMGREDTARTGREAWWLKTPTPPAQ
ncbi:hypothetical protein Purlil1_11693 [Purpureocillium lilacinum]|uniref:RING-type domain-containing protein n=1 Tax=Purpureocillium lilacinum TaxID=33203 RepID=A0ABR0BJ26_PURLI|nr:hypothetical protein Purlil1_11693 [Purpureocillium lilacinum]